LSVVPGGSAAAKALGAISKGAKILKQAKGMRGHLNRVRLLGGYRKRMGGLNLRSMDDRLKDRDRGSLRRFKKRDRVFGQALRQKIISNREARNLRILSYQERKKERKENRDGRKELRRLDRLRKDFDKESRKEMKSRRPKYRSTRRRLEDLEKENKKLKSNIYQGDLRPTFSNKLDIIRKIS